MCPFSTEPASLDDHLEAIKECLSDEEFDNLNENDKPLTEAIDGYVDTAQWDEMLALLVAESHLTGLYDEPMIDITSFNRIVNTCAYNLLYHKFVTKYTKEDGSWM